MAQEGLFTGRVEPIQLEDEIQRSYLDYAMSVIVGRALPDVRDGLKPVQRRILWSMTETGLRPDRPHRKSVSAVGDVLKKYHPHGDSSVYDALVRLAQDWVMRAPLVDGHGNFGSVDGDPPAAMRYCVTGDTRVRLADGGSARIRDLAGELPPDAEQDVELKVSGRSGDPSLATKVFHSGSHPVMQLETREGYRLTGSRNHPVLCLESIAGVPVPQWRLLEEIQPGARVMMLRRPTPLYEDIDFRNEDLAVLAGAWTAEGFVSEARAGFNNLDEEYFRRVASAYAEVVGGSYYVYDRIIRSGNRLYELDIQNMAALRESPLAEMIGLRSAQKRVPSFVWDKPLGFKRAFLQAMFEGDGSSSLAPRSTIQITYSSRSERLVRETQQLLLEFGIISRLQSYATGEWKVIISNRREARLFAARVGFHGTKQLRLLAQLDEIPKRSSAMSSDMVPFVAEYLRAVGATSYVDRDWLARHNIDRTERWERDGDLIRGHITDPEARRVVAPFVDGTYYYAEVTGVRDAGVEPVYSLRVDSDDHAFITDGFVSHNTEARLAPMAMELLRDIDSETVDFVPNFDGYEQEPTVLPARFPGLLVNGAAGIAVGMATNIPPHNLGEVIDAVCAMIDEPDIGTEGLMEHIKGPDFPTGAQIIGSQGINDAYLTGRGSIKVRAVTRIEEGSNNRLRIVVSELPYQVNKARLAEKIADLVRSGKIKDIADLRDESNREGMRLVVDLKRGANAQVVLNQLYKNTQLQESFSALMLSLVDGLVPKVLTLAEMIGHYLDHQFDVVTRRTTYELRKAEERDHIVKGLLIALDHLDEVIKIIRASADADQARTKLMTKFKLSEIQANHILDMPLRRLTKLAKAELEQEHKDLATKIKYLTALLKDPKKIYALVREELVAIRSKFANPRRTVIRPEEGEMDVLDLIPEEEVIVTVSRAGYIKRQPLETYRRQGRGGRGVRGATLKEEDVIRSVFTTTTHHWLLIFTTRGKVYRVKVHEVPEGSRTARGTFAANLPGVVVDGDERISAVLDLKAYAADKYLVFGTRNGMVKKTSLSEYDSPRTGLAAINLKEGDELIDVFLTDGNDDIFMISRNGQTIRFSETTARPMGRSTAGVIGMRLREGDEVLAIGPSSAGSELISVTGNGYGKRTDLKQYPRKGRGGLGVIGHSLTKKTGVVAGAFIGSKDQDVFLVSSSGIAIRVAAQNIRRVGRASQGVRTMRVEEGAHVAAMAPVTERDDDEAGGEGSSDAPVLEEAVVEKPTAAATKKPAAAKKVTAKQVTAKKPTAKRTTATKPVAKKPTTKRRTR